MSHFKRNDPILYNAALVIQFELPNRGTNYFKNITRSIIGQQLSVKAASTIFGRFEELVENDIVPEKVLRLTEDSMRGAGLSYAKARYVLAFADQVERGAISLENFPELSDEEVMENLVKIKGVGKWTAEIFLMFSLNRPDIFSHGDVGLQRAIKKLYGVQKYNFEAFEKISSRWSPYRTYACYVLWQSLDDEPK